MDILRQVPGGFVILCRSRNESHSFIREAVQPVVQCPSCGRETAGVELVNAYIYRERQKRRRVERCYADREPRSQGSKNQSDRDSD